MKPFHPARIAPILLIAMLCSVIHGANAADASLPRERISFNDDWRFIKGDPDGVEERGVDLTPYVNVGGQNVLAIRLDNPRESSRWYPGGGIYRNVWLVKTSPVHVAKWGAYVTTPDVEPDSATVRVDATIQNHRGNDARVSIRTEIRELNDEGRAGRSVASLTRTDFEIPAGESRSSISQVRVGNPRLWRLENPDRYVAITSVEQDGRVLDRFETPFGTRRIRFDARDGFLLNDRRVQLNGVCNTTSARWDPPSTCAFRRHSPGSQFRKIPPGR